MKLVKRLYKILSASFFIIVGGIILIFDKNNYKPIYKGFKYFMEHESYQISLKILLADPATKALVDTRYRQYDHVDWDALKTLPENTLGFQFAKFMNNPAVTPIEKLPESTVQISPEVDYIRARLRLTHDIHHVVCGFGADEMGEMGISAFYGAQINSPLNAMLLAFGLIKCTIKVPARMHELLGMITYGWQMGLTTPNIFGIKWEEMWDLPMDQVREKIGVRVSKAAA